MKHNIFILSLLAVALLPVVGFGQQEPQFTHYMYNTLSFNPAYAGQRETLSVVGLFRTQWVGLDGAPETQTLGIHSPLKNDRIALGLNVVRDIVGPSDEIVIDGNFSYTVPLNANNLNLTLGVKAGIHSLSTDWSKGRFQVTDPLLQNNLNANNLLLGAGMYLSNRKWYLGFSIPNFLTTDYYDDTVEALATRELHYYFTGGMVFNLHEIIKFKPAFLLRATEGSPFIADVSGNFLFNNRITVGGAWRLNDSLAALVGFQISKDIYIGYGYDFGNNNLRNYNNGSHEIILRFELQKVGRALSPRFF